MLATKGIRAADKEDRIDTFLSCMRSLWMMLKRLVASQKLALLHCTLSF